ncbi:hypothetical protein EUA62_01905 [TM7 phylum sp. oral taxon 348]|nr:hypothetical protein EUA62_01905 [TM7 phylum sp. oral taxon 348]
MASNRHLGRIVALQTLYEYEFRKDAGDKNLDYKDILERNLAEYKSSIDDVAFVDNLVSGVLSSTAKLDEELRPLAPEWPLEQILRIDSITTSKYAGFVFVLLALDVGLLLRRHHISLNCLARVGINQLRH